MEVPVKTRHRAALAPLIAAAGLGLAPAAQAATLESPVPCVRSLAQVKSFPLRATGFPAGASLSFLADGRFFASGQADAAGTFDNGLDPFVAPALDGYLRTLQVTADDGAGTVAGPIAVRMTQIAVDAPSKASPAERVRFRVFGFADGRRVYLHVRRNGATKKRVTMGRTSAPCGTLTKRMRFMPLRNYRVGTYLYAFSHSPRYRKDRTIFQAKVRISRTFSQATAAGAWG
jgi:hypothetical protein